MVPGKTFQKSKLAAVDCKDLFQSENHYLSSSPKDYGGKLPMLTMNQPECMKTKINPGIKKQINKTLYRVKLKGMYCSLDRNEVTGWYFK